MTTPAEAKKELIELGKNLLFYLKLGIGVIYTTTGAGAMAVGIKVLSSLKK